MQDSLNQTLPQLWNSTNHSIKEHSLWLRIMVLTVTVPKINVPTPTFSRRLLYPWSINFIVSIVYKYNMVTKERSKPSSPETTLCCKELDFLRANSCGISSSCSLPIETDAQSRAVWMIFMYDRVKCYCIETWLPFRSHIYTYKLEMKSRSLSDKI